MCHLRRDLSGCGHPSMEGVNPVRNSSGALNPGGIILKSNPAAEQQGIISNGVKIDGEMGDRGIKSLDNVNPVRKVGL